MHSALLSPSLPTSIIAQAPIGMLLADYSGVFFMNARAFTLFGYGPDALQAEQLLEALFNAKTRIRLRTAVNQVLTGNTLAEQVTRLTAVRADGALIHVEAHLSAVEYDGQRVALALLSDASELAHAHAALSQVAFHDSLTGLPNRALFLDRLNLTLRQSKRSGRGFAILALDLDGFKSINDKHGHKTGDLLLIEVGCVLLSIVRESDTVCRLGGDEFCIILRDAENLDVARKVADKIHRALTGGLRIDGMEVFVGASVGIVLCPQQARDMHGLMVAADGAMYEAKRDGGGVAIHAGGHGSGGHATSPLAIHWTPTLEYGVSWVDAEHRALSDAVNALVNGFSSAQELPVVQELMDELIDLAARHFANEEAHMGVLGPDEHASHVQEHVKALGELDRLRRGLENSGLSHMIQFIRDWLFNHIRYSDRHFCEALQASPTS